MPIFAAVPGGLIQYRLLLLLGQSEMKQLKHQTYKARLVCVMLIVLGPACYAAGLLLYRGPVAGPHLPTHVAYSAHR